MCKAWLGADDEARCFPGALPVSSTWCHTYFLFPSSRPLLSHPTHLPLSAPSPQNNSVKPRTLHALQLPYPSSRCSQCLAAPPPHHLGWPARTTLLGKAYQDCISLSPLGSHSPVNTPHPAAYPLLQLSAFALVPPLDWEHPKGRNPPRDSLLCPHHHLASVLKQLRELKSE